MKPDAATQLRINLARLLESVEQQAALLRACIQDLANETASTPPPPVREMIVTALEYAAPQGLSRSQIGNAIHRDYGVTIPPNTLTGTLYRLQTTGVVKRDGQTWFIA